MKLICNRMKYVILLFSFLSSTEVLSSNFRQFFQTETQSSGDHGLDRLSAVIATTPTIKIGSTTVAVNNSSFLTYIKYASGAGAYLTSSNNWQTIASITGSSGKIANILLPCTRSTDKKVHLQLDLDGVISELAVSYTSMSQMLILGPSFFSNTPSNNESTNSQWSTTKIGQYPSYSDRFFVDPGFVISNNLPYVQFKNRFVMKVMAEDYYSSAICNIAVVTYILDPPFVQQ